MYETMFELRRRPFASTVDIESYYASPRHEAALAVLQGCVTSFEGIGVLTGPTGTGKTLLSHLLLESLELNYSTIFVTNTHPTGVAAFYQAMLYDLSVPYEETNEQTLRLRLMDHLVRQFSAGQRTLLMVDEAHHLTIEQLEELRMLTNLEGRQERAIQILLFGGEGLLTTLRRTELDPLRQRIAAFGKLEPLDAEQTVEYVRCRIAKAGGSADTIFTAGALSEICERAEGIPRRINQLCHRALTNAWQSRSGTVDTLDIVEAAKQLDFVEKSSIEVPVSASKSAPVAKAKPSSRPSLESMRQEHAEPTNFVEVGAGIASPIFSPGVLAKPQLVPAMDLRVVEADAQKLRLKDAPRSSGMSRLRQLYSR